MTNPPALSAEWTVSADPRQVGIVRRQAATQVAEWGLPDLVDTVRLLLTELLTNAVEHTSGGCVDTRLSHHEGVLEIEVSDLGAGRAQLKKPNEEQESGRGLMIVNALALAWGTRPRADSRGKATWCTLKTELHDVGISTQATTSDIASPEKGTDSRPRVAFPLPRCLSQSALFVRSVFADPCLAFAFLSTGSRFGAAIGKAVLAA
ncbi:ATP-binding protein [Streptomyces sp. NPDC006251]|uniref:ATP-binding protein n=1 Tax=Streptomyces sp. NPDC006251 TaxID=3155718 RepID=UPI0033A309E3